jgi:predicted transcriptional regulator
MKLSESEIEELEREMLDDYCSAILIILWKRKEMRFNEIYRELRRKGTKLSKPTLSEHLKHLRKKKWITRKVRGVQNVSYMIHKSIKRVTDAEADKWLEDMLNAIGVHWEEVSPEEKVDYALTNILISKLEELAWRITIEPRIDNQALSFGSSKSRLYENELLSECYKDEEYKRVILGKTKELLKILEERRARA